MQQSTADKTFEHRVIAVPETRQLDVLADLLQKRGANVVRCPMIAINDAPDPKPIEAWLQRAIDNPADLIVFYTGEGVERLIGFAERAGIKAGFIGALDKSTKLCRGPKPKRALRRHGLSCDLDAVAPTTAGVIQTLAGLQLSGKRIGVQLYGDQTIPELDEFLQSSGTDPDFVAPYVYASAADDERVVELIASMRDGRIDAITFTSQSQVKRILTLARDRQMETDLAAGLRNTCVAAVGPVVAATLEDAGIAVDVMPEDSYFMKPLVTALAGKLNEPG